MSQRQCSKADKFIDVSPTLLIASGPSMLRYVLLALLADGQSRHGYALMKAYEERSGVRMSIGNVYRELQRLVGEGLIVTAVNPVGADPRRAPYTITAAGCESVAVWLAAPAYTLTRSVADALSYRLALLGDFDPEQAGAFLEDLYGELWSQTKILERERAAASKQGQDSDRAFSTRSILLDRRAKHLAADIELVDEMRSRLVVWRQQAATRSSSAALASEGVVRTRPRRKGDSRGKV